MPAIVDKIAIKQHEDREKLDRRVKLTKAQKEEIRTNYFAMNENDRPSQRALAKQHGVSKRLIQFILYPEREQANQERLRQHQKERRYYDTEKHRAYTQNHRDYKRSLLENGTLQLNNPEPSSETE